MDEARGAAARRRARAEAWPRSYLRRQGQPTRAQRRALREHWAAFGVSLDMRSAAHLDLDAIFGRVAPRVLDIGFGMGESLLAAAAAAPERDHLGVEVHRPGLGAALMGVAERGLGNVRVVRADAVALLRDHLAPASVDVVWVLFSDPWPKPVDRHRRLVRPSVVGLLERVLRPGGAVQLATDVADYAAQMREAFEGWEAAPLAARATTGYERRAAERGVAVAEMCFRRPA